MHLQPPTSSVVLYHEDMMRPRNGLAPRKWFRSERLKTVTAIGACVDLLHDHINWLIFYHGQFVTYLGDCDNSLKFYLRKGEKIVVVGHGVRNNAASSQVFSRIICYLRGTNHE